MEPDDTVTIPRKVYEAYRGTAASLMAAFAYGCFEQLSEQQEHELFELTQDILNSGKLK